MNLPGVPERPVLKRHFHVELVEPKHVFLLSEQQELVFSARAYRLLAPLLDGRRSVSEIVAELGDRVFAPEIFVALSRLAQAGALASGVPALPDEQAAFWDAQGVDANAAAQALAQARLVERVVGAADAGPLRRALADLGLPIRADGPGDLELVITEDYLDPALVDINAAALAQCRAWLPVQLAGPQIWVGPLFQPGATGCWACLAEQLRQGGPASDVAGQPGAHGGSLPTTVRFGASWAATEVAKQLARGPHSTAPELMVFDPFGLGLQRHALVRRPHCAACGS